MAKVPPYDPHNTEEEEVVKVQDRLRDFFKPVEECPLLNGVMIKDVSFTGGTENEINHTLGREPEGFLVVKIDDATEVFNSSAWDSEKIPLTATLNCTATLWVF